MTQDEIIEMARKAGCFEKHQVFYFTLPELEAFANLFAQHEHQRFYDAAMKAAEKAVDVAMSLEREACAKLCETLGVHPALNVWCGGPDWYKHGKDCAAAIRARGERA